MTKKAGFKLQPHSPTLTSLHLRHRSFANPSASLPTSQLILHPFRCFTYVIGTSLTSPGELPMHLWWCLIYPWWFCKLQWLQPEGLYEWCKLALELKRLKTPALMHDIDKEMLKLIYVHMFDRAQLLAPRLPRLLKCVQLEVWVGMCTAITVLPEEAGASFCWCLVFVCYHKLLSVAETTGSRTGLYCFMKQAVTF